MLRSWRFVVAWLSAAAVAVTVSWLGVQVGVAPAITDEAPVAIDVNRRYTEVRFGTADVVSPPPKPTPKPSRKSARPKRKPSTPPAAPAQPAPSRTATPTPSASPSPAAPDRRPRYRVNAEGGDVIVAYSSTRVDAIDADPRPGYVTTVTRRSNTTIVVRLTGPAHASVIVAFWNGGPRAQIVEEYG